MVFASKRSGSPWGSRLAVAAACSFVAFFVLYEVGMNVFLKTGLLMRVFNFDPTHQRLEYRNATSFLPSLVHVENLELRGSDSSVQWVLRIDRCDFQFSLFELVMRKFHALHVRGDGITFRLRLKVAALNAEHDAALPRVPGFEDPPTKDLVEEKPPKSDAEYDLWGVQLDDVHAAHIRELWVDTVRLSGALDIRGRWLFHPDRWNDVGPLNIEMDQVGIGYGFRPIIRDATGSMRVRVSPHDVRVPRGLAVLDQFSVDAGWRGTLLGADALDVLFPRAPASFEHVEGPLDVAVRIDHGILRPGTHVRTESEHGALALHGIRLYGTTVVTLDVHENAVGPPVGTIVAHTDGLTLRGDRDALAHVSQVRASLESRELDVASMFPDATYTAEVHGAETPQVGAWVPSSLPLQVDRGVARADLTLAGNVHAMTARGKLECSLQGLVGRRGEDTFGASAYVSLQLDEGALKSKTVRFGESTVRLTTPYFHSPAVDVRADVVAAAVRLDYSGYERTARGGAELRAEHLQAQGRAWHVEGGARVHAAGSASIAESTIALDGSDASLDEVTLVVTSRSGEPAATIAHLRVNAPRLDWSKRGPEGTLAFTLDDARSPNVPALAALWDLPSDVSFDRGRLVANVAGEVQVPALIGRAKGELTAADLGVHVGDRRMLGNLRLRLEAVPRDGATDLAGTTLSFDAPAENDPKRGDRDPWWLRIDVGRAGMRVVGDTGLHARVHLNAQDMRPVTALLASRTPVPKLVLDAFPMTRFESTADVHLGPKSFEVQSMNARGDGLTAELEYGKWPSGNELDLLLETSLLDAGIRSAEDGTQFTLADARSWFEERVAALRARESRQP